MHYDLISIFKDSFNQSPDSLYIWSSIIVTFSVLALNLISAMMRARKMIANDKG